MIQNTIERALGKKFMADFQDLLIGNGIGKGFSEFLRSCCVEGAGFSLIALAGMLYLKINFELVIVIAFFSFFVPGIVNYFFQLFLGEQRKKEIEQFIPDMLLQCSIFSKETPLHSIMKYVAESKYGRLSIEFERALQEMEKGATVEECLSCIGIRCRSGIVNRAINLLIQGYKSGKNMSRVFSETANDLLETGNILRERNAALLVEKWTILIGGALIVPSILGVLVGMVAKLNFGNLSFLGIGLSDAMREQLLSTTLLSNQIYLVEYGILAAIFVAQQEGNSKKAILYMLALIPLSLGIYYGIQLVKF